MYCKDCGHRLGIDRSKYTKANGEEVEKAYCICSTYKKYSKYHLCSNHKTNYFDLEEEDSILTGTAVIPDAAATTAD